jgi:hypothetical protein
MQKWPFRRYTSMLSILLQYLRCLQEADYSGKEQSSRGHHRGIRVLGELVGPWDNSATEGDEEI